MRYKILEIEQQLLDTLKGVPALSGVTIKIHAGELTQEKLHSPEMMQTLIGMRRFVLVQYQGKTSEKTASSKTEAVHTLWFRFYVGSVDVFQLSLAREDAYQYLSIVYDSIQGKWPGSSSYSLASYLGKLAGYSILGATNSSPIVLHIPSYGKKTGDKVYVRDVLGNTGANNTAENLFWTITKVDSDHVSLNGSVGNGDFVSGGSLIGAMTSTGFHALSGFVESDGLDQRIVVDTPDILVYQTDFGVKVVA